jgi:beta-barrel assembly-enhancing protease
MLKVLILSLFVACSIAAQDSQITDSDVAVTPEYLNSLVGQKVTLRGRPNINSVYYLPNGKAYFELLDDSPYLYFDDQEVTIDVMNSFDTTVSKCRIVFSNGLIGKDTMVLSTTSGKSFSDSIFKQAWSYMFVPPAGDRFQPYVRNTRSGIIHHSLCNHIPDASEQEFHSILQPSDTTDLCPSCFPHFDAIVDEAAELQLGMQLADQYETMYPVFDAEVEKLAKLRAAGEKVLSGWPTKLRGYQYSFNLVESRSLNAFAVPGGKVFVTTNLLNAMESEEELEALLAHEIAHVEYSHSLREYRKAQSAGRWGALFAGLAGVAIGAASDDKSVMVTALEISAAIASMAPELIVRGYSRDLERESDALAQLYLDNQYHRSLGLELVLQKLAYRAGDAPGDTTFEAMASHPTLYERIYTVRAGHSALYNPIPTFEGYDAQNRTVATVKLIASDRVIYVNKPAVDRIYGRYSKPTTFTKVALYAELSTSRYLKTITEIKDISLKFESEKLSLDNRADTRITPTQYCGVVFGSTVTEPVDFSKVTSIDIPSMKVITRWERKR